MSTIFVLKIKKFHFWLQLTFFRFFFLVFSLENTPYFAKRKLHLKCGQPNNSLEPLLSSIKEMVHNIAHMKEGSRKVSYYY